MADFDRESMLEMFSFEMSQLVEQLEQTIIQAESGYSMDQINEIFRIMHTIKGSAAMMLFDNISTTAHSIEDLFYYLREENPQNIDYSVLTDFVLEGMDFIKEEFAKIENGETADGDGSKIIQKIKRYLKEIKGELPPQTVSDFSKKSEINATHFYKAKIFFDNGCEMENIRAYTLVHNLGNTIFDVTHIPEDVIEEESAEIIKKDGFLLNFSSKIPYDEIHDILSKTVYLRELFLDEVIPTQTNEQSSLNHFKSVIKFTEDCEMENIRAFTVIQNIGDKFTNIKHEPENVIDESSVNEIRNSGFKLEFDTTMNYDEVAELLSSTIYLKDLKLEEVSTKKQSTEDINKAQLQKIEPEPVHGQSESSTKNTAQHEIIASAPTNEQIEANQSAVKKTTTQHVISVNVSKLDQLLNLMGELVIAEAMVTQNPELDGLELESFHKETLQLRKIINDVQDTVMSMRMVPLSTTFFKMHRIVRDMCKQLDKDVQLEISGEETEVDKNIIEHISDPLMHIIRNSIDHGIEKREKRIELGKPEKGTVHLEAKNSGGDVLIIIKDDGSGINKEKVMEKARNNGLLKKPESEYTDKEIQQFIFLPGFSTNEKVTAYSGRGVGMDVVSTNLEVVGGSVIVDSIPEEGSTFTLKIPLTLAIIEGMTIKMGGAKYTIPIISIKQSFKAKKENIFVDPSGNEMITVRGEVYNVVRLYEFFNVEKAITDIEEGIMIMLENGDQTICVLADELIGEQQVVVKTMPKYIKKVRGISGCTLLGNGDISLIIDVVGFFDK